MIVCSDRADADAFRILRRAFSEIGLEGRAIVGCLACRGCPFASVQAEDSSEVLWLKQSKLQEDQIRVMERGSPNSLPIMSFGRLAPGVKCVVVNPDTESPSHQDEVGELWIASDFNAVSYSGAEAQLVTELNATLLHRSVSGSPPAFCRTGLLGFINQSEVYVVGALETAVHVRGFTLSPLDIEKTIERSHGNIASCAVFAVDDILVAAVELHDVKTTANVAMMATTAVLTRHKMVLSAIVCLGVGMSFSRQCHSNNTS